VVTMADEKTARSLPTHFLLTSEVRQPEDLEHVDVLLGPHPKAPAALDLLLGTQGWRRFVEQTSEEHKSKFGEEINPFVALGFDPDQKRLATSFELEAEKLSESAEPGLVAAQRALADAGIALHAAQSDQPALDLDRQFAEELTAAGAAAQSADEKLADVSAAWQKTLDWLLPTVCI